MSFCEFKKSMDFNSLDNSVVCDDNSKYDDNLTHTILVKLKEKTNLSCQAGCDLYISIVHKL